ncbi:MAG: DUF2460 domain-containing protein, partial [Pseudomonadota bacterium]
MSFHDVVFPASLALGATASVERRTEIVTLANGHEERNAPWAGARRRWDAGTGVQSLDDLAVLIAFFEARQGRLYGFRWRDPLDHGSGLPSAQPGPLDQVIGTGDGAAVSFPLAKSYQSGGQAVSRAITKPVAGSVRVAVAGTELGGSEFGVDALTGMVTLASPPASGASVTAGFLFDVPARFDSDTIEVDLAAFR